MTKREGFHIFLWFAANLMYWISVIWLYWIDAAFLLSAFLVIGSIYLKQDVSRLHQKLHKRESERIIGNWQPFHDGIETLKDKITDTGGMPPISYSLTFILATLSATKYGVTDRMTILVSATFIFTFLFVQYAVNYVDHGTDDNK